MCAGFYYRGFVDGSLPRESGSKTPCRWLSRDDFCNGYQMSGKALYILFHRIGIHFEDIRDLTLIQQITEAVINLLSARYQVLSGIIGRKQGYQAVFLINSIGIDGRTVFYDRNQTYRELLDILRMMVGDLVSVELGCADNVLFTNKNNNSENYETYLGGGQ